MQEFDTRHVSAQAFSEKCQPGKSENHNVAVAQRFYSFLGWKFTPWKLPAGLKT